MKIPRYVLPLLLVLFLSGGYFLRLGFTQPTTLVSFDAEGRETLECVVDGLKCKGTAHFFSGLYSDRAGIASIETFGTEHRAIFTYDPSVITPDEIRAIMEAPVPLQDGSEVQAFRCLKME